MEKEHNPMDRLVEAIRDSFTCETHRPDNAAMGLYDGAKIIRDGAESIASVLVDVLNSNMDGNPNITDALAESANALHRIAAALEHRNRIEEDGESR